MRVVLVVYERPDQADHQPEEPRRERPEEDSRREDPDTVEHVSAKQRREPAEQEARPGEAVEPVLPDPRLRMLHGDKSGHPTLPELDPTQASRGVERRTRARRGTIAPPGSARHTSGRPDHGRSASRTRDGK